MGTPVLTVPASPPPTTPPANHVCHCPPRRLPPPLHGRCPQPAPRHCAGFPAAVHLCCQVHWSRRCHRRCCRVRSWNWLRLWLPHHRIRQEPLPEAAAFSYAILGFALSEAMGLFCLMMAFLLLFAF